MAENGNGNSRSWRDWALGIVALLVVALITDAVSRDRSISSILGNYGARLDNVERSLIERTQSRYSREDAQRDFAIRDSWIGDLRNRLDHRNP